MTLEEIRTAVRNLLKMWQEDTGVLLPSDDVILDSFINWAAEDVCLDLVPELPEVFLSSETITLVANQANYTPTMEYLQIWALLKNVSGENPVPITYIDRQDEAYHSYVGEKRADPMRFTLVGDDIYFVPKPSASVTDYAKLWGVTAETAKVASDGPAYIPRNAHALVAIQATIYIGEMNGQDTSKLMLLYELRKKRFLRVYSVRIQQQPRFLKGSVNDTMSNDSRDPALFDKTGFFRGR